MYSRRWPFTTQTVVSLGVNLYLKTRPSSTDRRALMNRFPYFCLKYSTISCVSSFCESLLISDFEKSIFLVYSTYSCVKTLYDIGSTAMELLFDNRALILCFDGFTSLVVADMHLDFESELLQRKGVAFPMQHPMILRRLTTLIE